VVFAGFASAFLIATISSSSRVHAPEICCMVHIVTAMRPALPGNPHPPRSCRVFLKLPKSITIIYPFNEIKKSLKRAD
jgi:hypothetical protein